MRQGTKRKEKGAPISRAYPKDIEAQGHLQPGHFLGGPDWDRIKEQYISSQLSIQEIAHQHGLDPRVINNRALSKGWKRNLQGEIQDTTRILLQEEAAQGVQTEEYDPATRREQERDAIVLSAARQAVTVIQGHRNRLHRVGAIGDKLLEKLEIIVNEEDPFKSLELRSTLLGPNESVFDSLVKLTNTIAKTIPLERQAFDMDGERDLKRLSDSELLKRACGEEVIDRLSLVDDEEDESENADENNGRLARLEIE